MSLEVRCLPPGGKLPAFNLTRRGDVTSININAFSAGKLRGGQAGKLSIVDRLANSAAAVLKQARHYFYYLKSSRIRILLLEPSSVVW